MTLPNELRHWPLSQVNTILFDIKYRLLPANALILVYQPHERELLTDLWRHSYIVLRDGLVLGQSPKCSMDDLRLSPEGEELHDRVWAEHRKTLPKLGKPGGRVRGS
jgi:hypothetical protein